MKLALLGISFVAAFTIVAVLWARGIAMGPSAGSAQPSGEPGDVRELAERLLAPPGGGSGSPAIAVELLPGELPPGLDIDLPMPAGSRLVGSAARRAEGALVGVDVVIDAPGQLSDVQAFYRDALETRGWSRAPASIGGPSGGFVPGPPLSAPELSMYCQGESGPMLIASFTSRSRDTVEVRLMTQSPRMFSLGPIPLGAMGGPCSPQASRPSAPFRGPESLPRLVAPPGIQLMVTGGSGGMNLIGSEAVAMTDRSAPDVEAAFTRALVDAGWTRIDGGASRPFAWSLWRVPGEPGGLGVLSALETPGENRVALSLKLYSAGPLVGPPFGPVGTDVAVPMNPALTEQQMAECLANSPDPRLC
jgi:hypothetical protein